MQCPKCGGKGLVTSTFDHVTTVQRYRRCRICNHKWKAWEEIDPHAVKNYRPRKEAKPDLFDVPEKRVAI